MHAFWSLSYLRRVMIVLAAATVLWSAISHPWAWAFGFGVHPYPGPQTPWTYQLYSGFLPALTVLSLVTLVAGAWHHINCHVSRCLRVGRHRIGGTPYCNRHQEQARITEHVTLEAIAGRLDRIIMLLERP